MVGPQFSPSKTFLPKDPELSPLRSPRIYVIGALLITQRQLGKLRLRGASGQPGADAKEELETEVGKKIHLEAGLQRV